MKQVHGAKVVTPYPMRETCRKCRKKGKHCYTLKAVLNLQESADAIVVKKLL